MAHDPVATNSYTTGDDAHEYLSKAHLERLGRQRPAIFSSWLTEACFVFTVVMSMMMSEYYISGFNIILPPVSKSLHLNDSAQTWPAAAASLTIAALLVPFARLCDIYSSRIIFLGGPYLATCVGSAAFLPAGLALLGCTYRPGPRKNLIFSIYGAFTCIGFYFGIFMGAVTAEFLNWRWYFWLGGIIVGFVALGGIFVIPRNLNDTDPKARMDWLGAVTIVSGLVLIVYAFTDGGHAPNGWATPYIYITLILGVVILLGAVYVQGWVSSQPLLPAELFRPKYMKRLIGSLFCAYGVYGLYLFYASFYIENVLHASPILTAAWFTPLAIGGVCLAIGGGFILHIIPNHILMIISGLGFILSVLLFALIPEQSVSKDPSTSFLYWAYIFPAMLCGTIGVDIIFNVTNIYITTAMPRRLQAAASGLINSLLYLGIAFWLGIGGLAISTTENLREESLPKHKQYRIGFWTGLGVAGLSLALTLTIRMGQASSGMTADEKAEIEHREMRQTGVVGANNVGGAEIRTSRDGEVEMAPQETSSA
ncbi:drug resistance protein [Nannizzia gypsea CBS 118893]|uniref:Drug resistance protein n=1 Tax=Arthroderma gypseum (strain ATCC MYA-4604 / CBS 118893) TaxID=535722 RepID=E4V1W8_ARTGP|nr:drug resistance protein [Nannizzia gypsea CBS 118893]EFR04033.1 drug resistance protein [Nannizzia gypsea CBS 118893]